MAGRWLCLFVAALLAGCALDSRTPVSMAATGHQRATHDASADFEPVQNASPRTNFAVFFLPLKKPLAYWVALGSDGDIWFSQAGDTNLGKVSLDGTITFYPVGQGTYDIVAGQNGLLWFTGSFSTIGSISTSGLITKFQTGSCPRLMALGQDGNMWANDTCTASMDRIEADGTVTRFGTSLAFEGNIAAGPDGRMWFLERTRSAKTIVGAVTMQGAITEYPTPSNLDLQSITSGPDGNMYVGETGAIARVSTAGVFKEFPIAPNGESSMITGPDGNIWFLFGSSIREFNIRTHHIINHGAIPNISQYPHHQLVRPEGMTIGADGDVWFGTNGDYIGRYDPKTTIIGIRLNGEMSLNDPTYGFEFGYAAGVGIATQTISLAAGTSVQFEDLDTISHSAAFLGTASPSPSTWPSSFTGNVTQSPAGTAIGTVGFATGSLNAGQLSPLYESGLPGFYMFGCQYHYVSNEMRTVIVVH